MKEREIQNYWPGRCFGCSRTNAHGLQLRFWHSEQGCLTRCTIPDHLCGVDGLVHGGIIATLLDEVAAWTIIAHLGKFGMTREMSIRYLKPVPTNTALLVAGQIIKQAKRIAVVRSTIHSTDEVLLAEGESKWLFPKLSSIAGMTGVDEPTLQQFLASFSQEEETD